MSEGRILIVGEEPEGLAGVLRGRGYDVVFLEELAETDDKSIDAELEAIRLGLSGAFGVSEEEGKKLVEMFERMQVQSAPLMVHEERERPHVVDGAKRGKKGKRLKDWQR